MNFDLNPMELAMSLFALIIAIPVHEFAHARSAVSNGDDTPRLDGRLTILPWDHFDPIGAFMCVFTSLTGIGLGWGKPVRYNPANLRHPRWDSVKIAVWGPFSNLLLATGFALAIRFGLVDGNPQLYQLFQICALVNLGLMMFNLIPIYPLDGSKVLAGFLPDDLEYRYSRFMAQWGFTLLILLLVLGRQTGLMQWLVAEPVFTLYGWLVGPYR